MSTKWVTLTEAADHAHCAAVTLAREIRVGRLKAYKLAGRRVWRLQLSDVDRWIGGSGEEPVPYVAPHHAGDRS
jgi:excisionase family DNA binding protein